MVYQGATGLYHFVINVIPFISNSVWLAAFSLFISYYTLIRYYESSFIYINITNNMYVVYNILKILFTIIIVLL